MDPAPFNCTERMETVRILMYQLIRDFVTDMTLKYKVISQVSVNFDKQLLIKIQKG